MIGEWLQALWTEAAHGSLQGNQCQACEQPAIVHVLATRLDGNMAEIIVCKDHLLDPGPLLDW